VQRVTGPGELLALSLPRSAAPATPAARARLLSSLAAVASERLLLATCERVELYLAGAHAGIPPLAQLRRGDAAARHLLRVAAGLESRVVGEPEIQGQVRAAFLEAQAQRALGPVLSALARGALHAGKRVRAETGLGRAPSLVTLTLARLSEQLRGLRHRALIVAGTGALANQILAALRGAGAGRLAVKSRSAERAGAVCARMRATPLHESDAQPWDALIACSNGPVALDGIAARDGAALVVVDLGVPPNVEAPARGARITRLHELTRNAGVKPAALRAAEGIVDGELQRFSRWLSARPAHAGRDSEAAA
jgi:glutamyl-tRNA reductase